MWFEMQHFSFRKMHLNVISHFVQVSISLLWRHNEHPGVTNHRRFDCLLNRLFRLSSKKTSKHVSLTFVTGEIPEQRASDAKNNVCIHCIFIRHRTVACSKPGHCVTWRWCITSLNPGVICTINMRSVHNHVCRNNGSNFWWAMCSVISVVMLNAFGNQENKPVDSVTEDISNQSHLC